MTRPGKQPGLARPVFNGGGHGKHDSRARHWDLRWSSAAGRPANALRTGREESPTRGAPGREAATRARQPGASRPRVLPYPSAAFGLARASAPCHVGLHGRRRGEVGSLVPVGRAAEGAQRARSGTFRPLRPLAEPLRSWSSVRRGAPSGRRPDVAAIARGDRLLAATLQGTRGLTPRRARASCEAGGGVGSPGRAPVAAAMNNSQQQQQQPPPPRKVSNVGSMLLTPQENESLFGFLGKKCVVSGGREGGFALLAGPDCLGGGEARPILWGRLREGLPTRVPGGQLHWPLRKGVRGRRGWLPSAGGEAGCSKREAWWCKKTASFSAAPPPFF